MKQGKSQNKKNKKKNIKLMEDSTQKMEKEQKEEESDQSQESFEEIKKADINIEQNQNTEQQQQKDLRQEYQYPYNREHANKEEIKSQISQNQSRDQTQKQEKQQQQKLKNYNQNDELQFKVYVCFENFFKDFEDQQIKIENETSKIYRINNHVGFAYIFIQNNKTRISYRYLVKEKKSFLSWGTAQNFETDIITRDIEDIKKYQTIFDTPKNLLNKYNSYNTIQNSKEYMINYYYELIIKEVKEYKRESDFHLLDMKNLSIFYKVNYLVWRNDDYLKKVFENFKSQNESKDFLLFSYFLSFNQSNFNTLDYYYKNDLFLKFENFCIKAHKNEFRAYFQKLDIEIQEKIKNTLIRIVREIDDSRKILIFLIKSEMELNFDDIKFLYLKYSQYNYNYFDDIKKYLKLIEENNIFYYMEKEQKLDFILQILEKIHDRVQLVSFLKIINLQSLDEEKKIKVYNLLIKNCTSYDSKFNSKDLFFILEKVNQLQEFHDPQLIKSIILQFQKRIYDFRDGAGQQFIDFLNQNQHYLDDQFINYYKQKKSNLYGCDLTIIEKIFEIVSKQKHYQLSEENIIWLFNEFYNSKYKGKTYQKDIMNIFMEAINNIQEIEQNKKISINQMQEISYQQFKLVCQRTRQNENQTISELYQLAKKNEKQIIQLDNIIQFIVQQNSVTYCQTIEQIVRELNKINEIQIPTQKEKWQSLLVQKGNEIIQKSYANTNQAQKYLMIKIVLSNEQYYQFIKMVYERQIKQNLQIDQILSNNVKEFIDDFLNQKLIYIDYIYFYEKNQKRALDLLGLINQENKTLYPKMTEISDKILNLRIFLEDVRHLFSFLENQLQVNEDDPLLLDLKKKIDILEIEEYQRKTPLSELSKDNFQKQFEKILNEIKFYQSFILRGCLGRSIISNNQEQLMKLGILETLKKLREIVFPEIIVSHYKFFCYKQKEEDVKKVYQKYLQEMETMSCKYFEKQFSSEICKKLKEQIGKDIKILPLTVQDVIDYLGENPKLGYIKEEIGQLEDFHQLKMKIPEWKLKLDLEKNLELFLNQKTYKSMFVSVRNVYKQYFDQNQNQNQQENQFLQDDKVQKSISDIDKVLKKYEEFESKNMNLNVLFEEFMGVIQESLESLQEIIEIKKMTKTVIEFLEELGNSQDSLKFIYDRRKNDVHEWLDFNDEMNCDIDAIIKDIAKSRDFLVRLYKGIQSKGQSLKKIFDKVINEFNTQYQNDASIILKLKGVNSNIDRLIRIVEAETEKAGRTVKIISDLILQGDFEIFSHITDQKCTFLSRVQRTIGGTTETFNQTELTQICSRGLLLSSAASSDKEQKQEQNNEFEQHMAQEQQQESQNIQKIEKKQLSQKSDATQFNKQIIILQEICYLVFKLKNNGHFSYQQFQKQFSNKIGQENCYKEMAELKQQLMNIEIEWDQYVNQILQNNYYMCFISNLKYNQIYNQLVDISQNSDQFTLSDEILDLFTYIIPQFKFEFTLDDITNKMLFTYALLDFQQTENPEQKLKYIAQFVQDFTIQHLESTGQKLLTIQKVKIKYPQIVFIKYNGIDNLFNPTINLLYSRDGNQTNFPAANHILLCHNEMKEQEIKMFFLRFFYSSESKLFLIFGSHLLSPQAKQQFTILFQDHLENKKYHKYANNSKKLLIFFEKLDFLYELKLYYQENFKQMISICQSTANQWERLLVQDKMIHQNLDKDLEILFSRESGMGKSYTIYQKIKNSNGNRIKIPLYGNIQKLQLIKKIKQKIKYRSQTKQCFHIEIYPGDIYALNVILFEILILKTIQMNQSEFLHIPVENMKVYLEVCSQSNLQLYNQISILRQFTNHQEQQFLIRNMRISNDINSNDQICLRNLYGINQKNDFFTQPQNDFSIEQNKFLISEVEGQELLTNNIVRESQNPNYQILSSFIRFFATLVKPLEHPDTTLSIYYLKEYSDDKKMQDHLVKIRQKIIQQFLQLAIKMVLQTQRMEQTTLQLQNQNQVQVTMNENEQLTQFPVFQEIMTDFIIVDQRGTQIMPCFLNKNSYEGHQELYHLYNQILIPTKQEIELPTLSNDKPQLMLKWLILIANPQKSQNIIQNFQAQNFIDLLVDKQIQEIYNNQEDVLYQQHYLLKKLTEIALTSDNFFKMALIYLRLTSNIPVILMGETGIGKTALVDLLADIMDCGFYKLNVHAGITEEQIIEFVNEKTLDAETNNKNVVLFFDEINTNVLVNGILKEILVDNEMQGEKLSERVRIIAACNPYKKKASFDDTFTAGLKHHKMKLDEGAKLVYRVEPMLNSLFQFIWNFDKLDQKTQEYYSFKIIELEGTKNKVDDFVQNQIKDVAQLVNWCQSYTVKTQNQWAVSLRDVKRFSKLFYWFLNNQVFRLENAGQEKVKKATVLSIAFCYYCRIITAEKRSQFEQEIFKEFAKTEFMQLKEKEFQKILQQEQELLIEKMSPPQEIAKNFSLKENLFVMLVCLLNKIPLFLTGGPGSSKTLSLNLLVKQLKGQVSKDQFFQSLPFIYPIYYQGHLQSTSEKIDSIFIKAEQWQEKLKKQIAQENKQKKLEQQQSAPLVLIVIDEIGLAELSPYNPLKVLHSRLEPPQVSFVGISNWNLDASKMNRALHLSRIEANKRELEEIAETLLSSVKYDNTLQQIQPYIQKLATIYLEYKDKIEKDEIQQTSQKKFIYSLKYFHGQRDYYGLIKYICRELKEPQYNYKKIDRTQIIQLLYKGHQKNFGGLKGLRIFNNECFCKNLEVQQEFIIKNNSVSNGELIIENLKESDISTGTRHLMIISDNKKIAFQWVLQQLGKLQKQSKSFIGSCFEQDQATETAFKLISDIILCIENGIICVMSNLEYIYQSFYDVLNQNYIESAGKLFSRIGFGADYSRIEVHRNFKFILICDEQDVQKMDPPLLNRFEKQEYKLQDIFGQDTKSTIRQLEGWIRETYYQIYNVDEVSNQVQMLAQSFVLTFEPLINSYIRKNELDSPPQELLLKVCKQEIINLNELRDTIILHNYPQGQDEETGKYLMEYQEDAMHNSLLEFVDRANGIWRKNFKKQVIQMDQDFEQSSMLIDYQKNFQQEYWQDNMGFQAVVFTCSNLNPFYRNQLQELKLQIQEIQLTTIQRKEDLQFRLNQFYDMEAKKQSQLLVIHCQVNSLQSQDILEQTISMIDNSKEKKAALRKFASHILIIVQTKKYELVRCYNYFPKWKLIFIDTLVNTLEVQQLNTQMDQKERIKEKLYIKNLMKGTFDELILDDDIVQYFLTEIKFAVQVFKQISYQYPQPELQKKIQFLNQILEEKDNESFKGKAKTFITNRMKDFINSVIIPNQREQFKGGYWIAIIAKEALADQFETLEKAILEFFRGQYVLAMATMVHQLESENIYEQQMKMMTADKEIQEFWQRCFEEIYQENSNNRKFDKKINEQLLVKSQQSKLNFIFSEIFFNRQQQEYQLVQQEQRKLPLDKQEELFLQLTSLAIQQFAFEWLQDPKREMTQKIFVEDYYIFLNNSQEQTEWVRLCLKTLEGDQPPLMLEFYRIKHSQFISQMYEIVSSFSEIHSVSDIHFSLLRKDDLMEEILKDASEEEGNHQKLQQILEFRQYQTIFESLIKQYFMKLLIKLKEKNSIIWINYAQILIQSYNRSRTLLETYYGELTKILDEIRILEQLALFVSFMIETLQVSLEVLQKEEAFQFMIEQIWDHNFNKKSISKLEQNLISAFLTIIEKVVQNKELTEQQKIKNHLFVYQICKHQLKLVEQEDIMAIQKILVLTFHNFIEDCQMLQIPWNKTLQTNQILVSLNNILTLLISKIGIEQMLEQNEDDDQEEDLDQQMILDTLLRSLPKEISIEHPFYLLLSQVISEYVEEVLDADQILYIFQKWESLFYIQHNDSQIRTIINLRKINNTLNKIVGYVIEKIAGVQGIEVDPDYLNDDFQETEKYVQQFFEIVNDFINQSENNLEKVEVILTIILKNIYKQLEQRQLGGKRIFIKFCVNPNQFQIDSTLFSWIPYICKIENSDNEFLLTLCPFEAEQGFMQANVSFKNAIINQNLNTLKTQDSLYLEFCLYKYYYLEQSCEKDLLRDQKLELKRPLTDFIMEQGKNASYSQFLSDMLKNFEDESIFSFKEVEGGLTLQQKAFIILSSLVISKMNGNHFHNLLFKPDTALNKEHYVPFMINSEFSIIIFTVMKTEISLQQTMTRYVCKNCNEPFLVANCGNTVIAAKCVNCGKPVANQDDKRENYNKQTQFTQRIDQAPLNKNNINQVGQQFDKGFIQVTPDFLPQDFSVRNLSLEGFRIGHLLTYSLLLSALQMNNLNTDSLYQNKIENSLQVFGKECIQHIKNDWSILKKQWRINEEQMLLILYETVKNIQQKTNNIEKFDTNDQRIKWEDQFQAEIVIFVINHMQQIIEKQKNNQADKAQQLLQDIVFDNINNQIKQQDQFKKKFFIHQFRIIEKITKQRIFRDINTLQSQENQFISIPLLETTQVKQQIEHIQSYLIPLLNFYKQIKQRFEKKIKLSQLQTSLDQFLDLRKPEDNAFYQYMKQQIIPLWNELSENYALDFQCEQNFNLPKLSDQLDKLKVGYFVYYKDDAISQNFYLLIQDLCQKQNNIIKSIQQALQNNPKNKERLYSFNQIMGYKENGQELSLVIDQLRENNFLKYRDEDVEEYFEMNSISELLDSQYNGILIDFEKIEIQVLTLVFQGKVKINLEGSKGFEFAKDFFQEMNSLGMRINEFKVEFQQGVINEGLISEIKQAIVTKDEYFEFMNDILCVFNIMLNSDKKEQGKYKAASLKDILKTYNLGSSKYEFVAGVRTGQVARLIELLEVERMDELVEQSLEIYKDGVGDPVCQAFYEHLKRKDLLLDDVRLVVGRFIIRQCCSLANQIDSSYELCYLLLGDTAENYWDAELYPKAEKFYEYLCQSGKDVVDKLKLCHIYSFYQKIVKEMKEVTRRMKMKKSDNKKDYQQMIDDKEEENLGKLVTEKLPKRRIQLVEDDLDSKRNGREMREILKNHERPKKTAKKRGDRL